MGPPNDKALAKSTAMPGIDWLDEYEDVDGYHFKICDPRINVESEYQADLSLYIRNISRLVSLDEFRIQNEDSIRIVKVRLRLNAVAFQQNMTLDAAIRTFCRSMMTADVEGRHPSVENLTPKSIWGIVPISEVFRTYWTASFFNKILSEGPHVFSSLAEDMIREDQPYLCPTFMVFAFAALAGLHDCFHLMRHFSDLDPEEPFDLQDFIKRVLPTVRRVFTFVSVRTSAGESLAEEKEKFNQCIWRFTQSYDEVLDRFGTVQSPTGHMLVRDIGWMHSVCNSLCKMSNAASTVLVLRQDLLNEVVYASIQAQSNAIQGGIVALGSLGVGISKIAPIVADVLAATASAPIGALSVPLIAFIVAFKAAKWAHDSHETTRELNSQRDRFRAVFSITTVTWTSVYHIRLALEWSRLHEGENPSALQLPDPASQGMWQTFVDSYNAVTRRNDGVSFIEERLLSMWIDEKVHLLREQRQTLTTTLGA